MPAFSLLLLAWAGPDGPPLLDRPALDLGTLARQARRTAVVRLSNPQSRPFLLQGTEADCVCLQSAVPILLLEPGQTVAWNITLETCEAMGEVRRSVWLNTDSEPIRLPVRYQVVPELFVEPNFVSLGLLGDAPVETVFQVKTLEAEPILLLNATCDDPNIDIQILRETVTSEKPGQVWIRAQPRGQDESFCATLWLETSCPELPRLRVPLIGEAVTGLRADVRLVRFEDVPLRTAQTQTVTFDGAPGVRIGGIRTSDDAVDAVSAQRAGDQVIVTLRTNPRRPLGTFQGQLLLEVQQNGQNRRIGLPYWGHVTEAPSKPAAARSASPNKPSP